MNNKLFRLLFFFIRPIALSIFHVNKFADLIDGASEGTNNGTDFIHKILKILDVKHETYPSNLDYIPKTGPLVIVANHPFGGLEALVLYEILKEKRSDVKFIANYILGYVHEMNEQFILVDPFESKESASKNIKPLREALAWLKEGHCLITFPSGTVSYLHREKLVVKDPAWNVNIARLIQKSNASVVPFFVQGKNSLFFLLAGVIRPIFRTMLLPRQLMNKQGKTIKVKVGKLLSAAKLRKFQNPEELIAYLRLRTDIQKNSSVERQEKRLEAFSNYKKNSSQNKKQKPIAEKEDFKLLQNEIDQLPKKQFLLKNKQYLVAYANAKQIPCMLREIGRAREESFREVGEGSGKSRDLDQFDNYYDHLFCIDTDKKELVGAYRVGKTDEIFAAKGMRGLYTYSLFHYTQDLLDQLGPSLEMGRSFVRPEYQKTYWPLLSLWKGIGAYVTCFPKYKTLFGPVSISDSYDRLSQHLMTTYLKEHNFESKLAELVRPRNRSQSYQTRWLDHELITRSIKDLAEVSELIADIELGDQKSVPVLLREYIKLGGKIIGFNVDPHFSCVLDGLIVVDLTKTNEKLLERYMGKEKAHSFLGYHRPHGVAGAIKDS